MTEPLNLDALYALAREKSDHDDAWFTTMMVINELRATRVELERERVMHRGVDPQKARYERWWREYKDRAERAEARIAAVRKEIEAQSYNGGWHYAFVIKPALLGLCGE